jgi:hypothetical protein
MIATKRSLAKASIDPEFTSSLNPEGLEVMSTDKRWMTSLHGLFENLDCSRKLLLLLLI